MVCIVDIFYGRLNILYMLTLNNVISFNTLFIYTVNLMLRYVVSIFWIIDYFLMMSRMESYHVFSKNILLLSNVFNMKLIYNVRIIINSDSY